MIDTEIHFFGILTNVDSSILLLELDEGFEIVKESLDSVRKIIAKLENSTYEVVTNEIIRNHILPDSDGNLYSIRNKQMFTVDLSDAISVPFDSKTTYLNNLLRKIRLFKEGNINLPMFYTYFKDKGDLKIFYKGFTKTYINIEFLHLENSEIPYLESFLKDIDLPFNSNFLEFALKILNYLTMCKTTT